MFTLFGTSGRFVKEINKKVRTWMIKWEDCALLSKPFTEWMAAKSWSSS